MRERTQAQREALVRQSLVQDDRLVRLLAEWVGRNLSGYDWQDSIPWRIEREISVFIQRVNRFVKQEQMMKPVTLEIPARDAQRLGAVVDHDLAPVNEQDEAQGGERTHDQALLDALDLGIEPVGLGV
ncbi:hypothetical protein THIX_60745 [Thiomonas sp. X19]|uniref:hypothetical protein n=1 Tax=Thiomonas sp. X19 TaxID=1050370 RepID=UPI000B65A0AD|nr:hypothetical protein [Thiomonas sp. X19]SCC93530.1 hypothetical protein THIX_30758 [Thiomonas sp. X19]SCC94687.1 hypothetical protein THIX_60745 [Thiomonas sp. X19]